MELFCVATVCSGPHVFCAPLNKPTIERNASGSPRLVFLHDDPCGVGVGGSKERHWQDVDHIAREEWL